MFTRTAVVCGASMSGLLAARVLADGFDTVGDDEFRRSRRSDPYGDQTLT